MNLNNLSIGQKAVIIRIRGRGAFRRRVMEMGFVSGETVQVIRKAPLNDPLEFQVKGSKVILRRSEAELIEVSPDLINGIRKETGTQLLKSEYRQQGPRKQNITVVLIGNTTSGKTRLFNNLTGLSEKVSNYAGVTVEAKSSGFLFQSYSIKLIDLPGVYSLSGEFATNRIVRDCLLYDMPDVIINVVDSCNLERNLFLTTDLIDSDQKVIMALSRYDEYEKNGNSLDYDLMGKLMGIPVVCCGSSKEKPGNGNELLQKVIEVFNDSDRDLRHVHINYSEPAEKSIRNIQQFIKLPENSELTNIISSRFLAIKLLQGDKASFEMLARCKNESLIREAVAKESLSLKSLYHAGPEQLIADYKYGFINGALKETMKTEKQLKSSTDVIDSILTNKLFGLPIFALFMWLMFTSTFKLGQYPMTWIENLVGWVSLLINNAMPDGILKDLLTEGVISGVGGVLVFLPNILILYFFISLMEDTGYMSRAVFIMDRLMHRIGLHGKSFIPLVMGFGCNVPAILATRMLESKRERLITMLINPFISCNARLPVYILFITAFFPEIPGTILFIVYFTGILIAIITALILKRFMSRRDEQPFVMELPLYRAPSAKVISKQMWERSLQYLKKIGGVILIASVIFWALSYFPRNVQYSKDYDAELTALSKKYSELSLQIKNDTASQNKTLSKYRSESSALLAARKSEQREKSYMGHIGYFIEPVIRPLGFDWRIGISIISGIPAKEIIVSSLAVLYQADSEAESGNYSLVSRLQSQQSINKAVALAFMIFVLLYIPCIGTLTAIIRESGSWKWGVFSLVYSLALAWGLAFIAYRITLMFI